MLRNAPNPTHAQALVSLRTGKPVEQVLRELYLDRRLSQAAIAEELGITRVTVAMWLREFAIERPDIALLGQDELRKRAPKGTVSDGHSPNGGPR